MQACEFNSVIDNGIIRLPEQYRNTIPSSVKIIVLFDDVKVSVAAPVAIPKKKFSAIKLKTKGFKFDREEANER
jgi:hypothetical protein